MSWNYSMIDNTLPDQAKFDVAWIKQLEVFLQRMWSYFPKFPLIDES